MNEVGVAVATETFPYVYPLRFQLGCDPEVFAVTIKGVLPAYKFLPHKRDPITFRDGEHQLGESSIFWDGLQAEMTTPADACIARIVDAVHYALKRIRTAAIAAAPDARLTVENVVAYPKHERLIAAKEHVELGCSPSRNVYGDAGRLVRDGRALPVRFAGGHIHFGSSIALDKQEEVVRALDAILGIWSVGAAASIDNPIRRKFYGLAGEYRPTKYGVEYRSLSNFWLCHPGIMSLTFEIARVVLSAIAENAHYAWQVDEREVRKVINESDVAGARAILTRNAKLFNYLMGSTNINSRKAREAAINVGLHGIESAVPLYRDIEANWGLQKQWIYHATVQGAQWTTLADESASAT